MRRASNISTLHGDGTLRFAKGLKPAAARAIVEEVARCVDGWRAHFAALGVRAVDLEMLAQYLEGERLGRQRREFAVGRRGA